MLFIDFSKFIKFSPLFWILNCLSVKHFKRKNLWKRSSKTAQIIKSFRILFTKPRF